jgi:tetratricopeptide (TPR) repeat protein
VRDERDEPTTQEKRDQLERILASKPFSSALKPAKVLRFIVESDLDGKTINEGDIGEEVLGRRKNWITQEDSIVRENLRRVRNLLDQYYRDAGREDKLRLEVPGYKPLFIRNHLSRFEQCYRRALRHISTNPEMAIPLLRSALVRDPNHPGAQAAWAETLLWPLLCGYDIPVPEILSGAEECARTALQFDREHWRAHIVMGAIHCCRREWESAAAAFSSALDDSPEETSGHPWYAAFLMATAKTKEALKLVKAKADENPTDDWAQLTYALFLYVAREFKEAQKVLGEIQSMGDRLWLADVMWSCICLALGERESAIALVRKRPRLAGGELAYPALFLLCDRKEPPPHDSEARWTKSIGGFWETRDLRKPEQPPSDSRNDPEITSTLEECDRDALAGWERPEGTSTDSQLAEISADGHYQVLSFDATAYVPEAFLSPCQLALGYVALGEMQRAIELLGKDFDRNHPLLVWLHLWPVLDPLREDEDFQGLIRRMALPSQHEA